MPVPLARGRETGTRRRAVEDVELADLQSRPGEDVCGLDLADIALIDGCAGEVGPVGVTRRGNKLVCPHNPVAGHPVSERRATTPGEKRHHTLTVEPDVLQLAHRRDTI